MEIESRPDQDIPLRNKKTFVCLSVCFVFFLILSTLGVGTVLLGFGIHFTLNPTFYCPSNSTIINGETYYNKPITDNCTITQNNDTSTMTCLQCNAVVINKEETTCNCQWMKSVEEDTTLSSFVFISFGCVFILIFVGGLVALYKDKLNSGFCLC